MSDTDLIKLYSQKILALAAEMPHTARLSAPDWLRRQGLGMLFAAETAREADREEPAQHYPERRRERYRGARGRVYGEVVEARGRLDTDTVTEHHGRELSRRAKITAQNTAHHIGRTIDLDEGLRPCAELDHVTVSHIQRQADLLVNQIQVDQGIGGVRPLPSQPFLDILTRPDLIELRKEIDLEIRVVGQHAWKSAEPLPDSTVQRS
mgnify:CR=1 FL=1